MLRIPYWIIYCVWFSGCPIRRIVGDGYYGMGSNSIEQIKELDDKVCELDKKIAQQDAKFADMKGKISDQNTDIAHQDTRFAEMNTLIANQNTKIAEMKLLINWWRTNKQQIAGRQQISNGYQQSGTGNLGSGYQQSGTDNRGSGYQQSSTGNQQSYSGNRGTGYQIVTGGTAQERADTGGTTQKQIGAGVQPIGNGNTVSKQHGTGGTGNKTIGNGIQQAGDTNQQIDTTDPPSGEDYPQDRIGGIGNQQRGKGNQDIPTGGTGGNVAHSAIGSIFIRWGRRECPVLISELVYAGYTGGSHHSHSGGAAEYVCLPPDPTWNINKHFKSPHWGYMYGTEYDSVPQPIKDYKVPCAVCRTSQFSTVLMIPARTECYQGWQKAYHGELVSGYYKHKASSQYVCLDEKPHTNSSVTDYDGKLMYSVQAKCGALPCPPYEENALLTCVVCLK